MKMLLKKRAPAEAPERVQRPYAELDQQLQWELGQPHLELQRQSSLLAPQKVLTRYLAVLSAVRKLEFEQVSSRTRDVADKSSPWPMLVERFVAQLSRAL